MWKEVKRSAVPEGRQLVRVRDCGGLKHGGSFLAQSLLVFTEDEILRLYWNEFRWSDWLVDGGFHRDVDGLFGQFSGECARGLWGVAICPALSGLSSFGNGWPQARY